MPVQSKPCVLLIEDTVPRAKLCIGFLRNVPLGVVHITCGGGVLVRTEAHVPDAGENRA